MKLLFTFLFLIVILPVYTQIVTEQEKIILQLKETIKKSNHDSLVVNAYFAWDDIIWLTDPKLDLELNIKIEKICLTNLDRKLTQKEKTFFLLKRAKALNNLGSISFDKGKYDDAISKHAKSLKIREELNDHDGIPASLNNLANVYMNQGNHTKAIDYYSKGLKLFEKRGLKKETATALNNIGTIYKEQGEYERSMKYQRRSLKIRKEIKDKEGIASSLNNIGILCQLEKKYIRSIEIFKESLDIQEEIGNKKGISGVLNNIGVSYKNMGNYDEAIDYYKRSLEIDQELNNSEDVSVSLSNIGSIYYERGNYAQAISFCERALKIATEMGFKTVIRDACGTLHQTYKRMNQTKLALEMFEQHITIRDEINSAENQKEIIRQEYKYTYDKQVTADRLKKQKTEAVAKLKDRQQEQQAYFLFGGLALSLLFGGFIFNRFRITSKQKVIIEEQKQKVDEAFDKLEEKNSEILDSILYAKRIQSAILPSAKVIENALMNSFILYKPKDIVAGDFYWIERKGDLVLFAAADCTGHGVPGALVSVICHNALNRSVREYGLTNPGLILNKTREIVVAEFEKSDEDVKDGMDIALCSLEGNILCYAGANNPLWLFRNNELIEIKANRQPVGKFENYLPYTTHRIELIPGDTIYIFSDGYADQFGGEYGKKFRIKSLKDLLMTLQAKAMAEQKEFLNEAFENWKGDLEQLDDVCVIGLRF